MCLEKNVIIHTEIYFSYTPGWKFIRYSLGYKPSCYTTVHKLGEGVVGIGSIQDYVSEVMEHTKKALRWERTFPNVIASVATCEEGHSCIENTFGHTKSSPCSLPYLIELVWCNDVDPGHVLEKSTHLLCRALVSFLQNHHHSFIHHLMVEVGHLQLFKAIHCFFLVTWRKILLQQKIHLKYFFLNVHMI